MIRIKKQVINAYDNNGVGTGPYLVRWALNTPLVGIKLHHILRSDEDRDLHDHPWSFLSIILVGGYFEHTYARCTGRKSKDGEHAWGTELGLGHVCRHCFEDKTDTRARWYGPGSVLWRPAPSVHRLELRGGRNAWTLVFTGPKRREWGFHTVCGFIPWFKYNEAKADGC